MIKGRKRLSRCLFLDGILAGTGASSILDSSDIGYRRPHRLVQRARLIYFPAQYAGATIALQVVVESHAPVIGFRHYVKLVDLATSCTGVRN